MTRLPSNHGGDIFSDGNIFAIDFSSSINPLGISPSALKILKNINSLKLFLENYPESYPEKLIKALSVYHDIDSGYFYAGAGATDIIYQIFKIFNPRKTVIIEPSFSEYEKAAKFFKSKVRHIMSDKKNNFELSQTVFVKIANEANSLGKNEFLFIANPSNPAGKILIADYAEEILRILKKKGSYLAVDESFIDFCEKFSVKHLINKYNNLLIIRSLTKFFAIPGLRVGYIMADKNIVKKFLRNIVPWKITELASAVSIASLQDKEYAANSLEKIKKNKFGLYNDLKKINCFSIFYGEANFFLIRINSGKFSCDDLRDYLLESKILIRCCDNFYGLSKKYFRISVKKETENSLLINEIKRFIKLKL